MLQNQENLNLFLNTQVVDVKKNGNKIVSVIGKNIISGKEYIFKAQLFSDCTAGLAAFVWKSRRNEQEE